MQGLLFRTFDSKTLRVDVDSFKYGEKNLRFRKIPGYVWTVKYDSKTLRVDADFSLNTEEKISIFENTRLCVDEA